MAQFQKNIKSKGMLSLDIGPKTGQFKNSNYLYQCGYDDLYEKVFPSNSWPTTEELS